MASFLQSLSFTSLLTSLHDLFPPSHHATSYLSSFSLPSFATPLLSQFQAHVHPLLLTDQAFIAFVCIIVLYSLSWSFISLPSSGLFYPFRVLYTVYLYFVYGARCCLPFLGDNPVYLLDFATAKLPEDWQMSTERFSKQVLSRFFTPDQCEFMLKLLARSGLGEKTHFPPSVLYEGRKMDMGGSREEAQVIIFSALDQLFAKLNIHPKDVDILIVNCSLFNPTPSLAAMIINKYKMREDVQSYNLAGMGCSAGVISIHLARDLLSTYNHSLAIVVSTEIITQCLYTGNEKSMLLQNSLFRCGGAAVALTNKPVYAGMNRAKYTMCHTLRTTMAHDTQAYSCVYQEEDVANLKGIRLGKELMAVAAKALTKNITKLGPKILPWSEQIKYGLNALLRTLDRRFRIGARLESLGLLSPVPAKAAPELVDAAAPSAPASPAANHNNHASPPASPSPSPSHSSSSSRPQFTSRFAPYVPNFKTCVDYFCIHAGGRGVIDAIQKALNLSDEDVEPSRWSLYTYGNTSSSSIWYELEHIEATRKLRRGNTVWQIGFGSGFKCNSAIWKKL